MVLLLSLRPYLAVAVAFGVVAWAVYPWARRMSVRQWAVLGITAVGLSVALLVTHPRRLEFAAHEMLYRQTVTRMETLGRLYTDEPADASNLPIRPGSAVAVADPQNGWLLTGVLQNFTAPDVAQVAFTDESIRQVPLAQITLLQSATIPPLQLLAWAGPDLFSFLLGTSTSSDSNNAGWIADALVWDALLLAACVAAWRTRVNVREWLYPLCVVGGTVLALVAIPGAPGNTDRHRSTQTVPLLVVLAAGLAASRLSSPRAGGLNVTNTTTSAIREPTAAASRTRSAR
jgi:hypothetical protein